MELIEFGFQGSLVRIVMKDGDPWFVAKDVARTLGYINPQKAVRSHCKRPQPVGVNESVTLDKQTVIIPESDVYRLIMRSKLPSAEAFEELVMEEILPTIRKTGGYQAQPQYQIPQTYSEALQLAADLQQKIEEDEPYADYGRTITVSEGAMNLTKTAKTLGIGRNKFTQFLRDCGVLFKNDYGINQPRQRYIDEGWFEVAPVTYNNGEGLTVQTFVTGKGQQKLHDLTQRYMPIN